MNKEQIIKTYVEYTKKLNKFPTKRDINRLLPFSCETVYKHFSSLNSLQKEVLDKHPEIADQLVSAKLTRKDVDTYRFDKEGKLIDKLNNKLLAEASFVDYIEKFSEKVFSGQITNTTLYKSKEKTKRYLNLVLSDLHFGADIDGEETGVSDYGKTEEARRFAQVIKEVCTYKTEYRKQTELNVFLLGDIIQGSLGHDPRDGAPLAEQYCRAIHLLGQGLAVLSKHFKRVNVYCTSGNHDRIFSRHQGRAVHGKYDSYATMLYYSLKKSVDKIKNISFLIPKTPYVVADVFDKKIFAWHGDTGIKVGNPSTSINSANIEKSINKVNASLKDNDEYNVFICGHVHLGTVNFMTNGATLIVNGGLPPTDAFGVSIGINETNSGQMLFESVEEYPVGDVRFIRVNSKTDEDESLDNIIKPWEGYND